MNIDVLRDALKNNHVDKAINLINEMGKNKCQEAVGLLIEYLQTTNNNILRNSIAIALSDIGNPLAIEPLINTLGDIKTLGNRGTLLYALEAFDCSEYIVLFVDFLINGNFEESRQAFSLIESSNHNISTELINNCIIKLTSSIEELEDKIDFLSEAVEVIENLNTKN